jgi:rRNA maturation RNase YbeY
MIRVYVKKEITCPISAVEVKRVLSFFLKEEGIVSNADVSVAFVGQTKMLALASKYLKERHTLHNVLSFPYSEGGKFVYPPEDVMHLGDIVICYPKALEEAKKEGVQIKEKTMELICHGALHLLGKHHD